MVDHVEKRLFAVEQKETEETEEGRLSVSSVSSC
jgi:hypothetical protein